MKKEVTAGDGASRGGRPWPPGPWRKAMDTADPPETALPRRTAPDMKTRRRTSDASGASRPGGPPPSLLCGCCGCIYFSLDKCRITSKIPKIVHRTQAGLEHCKNQFVFFPVQFTSAIVLFSVSLVLAGVAGRETNSRGRGVERAPGLPWRAMTELKS